MEAIRQRRKEKEEEKIEELWGAFVRYLSHLGSQQEIDRFLKHLLGDRQRRNVARRLAISLFLQSGNSYRAIATELRVSQSVIRSVRKSFRGGLEYKSWRKIDKLARAPKNNISPEDFAVFKTKDLTDLLTMVFHGKTIGNLHPRRKRHYRIRH